jgi:hypothetical protein
VRAWHPENGQVSRESRQRPKTAFGRSAGLLGRWTLAGWARSTRPVHALSIGAPFARVQWPARPWDPFSRGTPCRGRVSTDSQARTVRGRGTGATSFGRPGRDLSNGTPFARLEAPVKSLPYYRRYPITVFRVRRATTPQRQVAPRQTRYRCLGLVQTCPTVPRLPVCDEGFGRGRAITDFPCRPGCSPGRLAKGGGRERSSTEKNFRPTCWPGIWGTVGQVSACTIQRCHDGLPATYGPGVGVRRNPAPTGGCLAKTGPKAEPATAPGHTGHRWIGHRQA